MASEAYHNPWRDAQRPARWLEFRTAPDAPDRSEELGLVAAAALHRVPSGGRVLELGCGDGGLSERLLAARRDITLVALDLRQEMLDAAAQRLSGDRLTLIQHDLETDGWPHGAAPPFDSATSALAFHLLAAERHHTVLRRVASVLRPGGTLVLLDTFRDSEEGERLRWDLHAQVHPTLWRGGVNANAPKLDRWPALLRVAGFVETRVLWVRWPLVVISAATPR